MSIVHGIARVNVRPSGCSACAYFHNEFLSIASHAAYGKTYETVLITSVINRVRTPFIKTGVKRVRMYIRFGPPRRRQSRKRATTILMDLISFGNTTAPVSDKTAWPLNYTERARRNKNTTFRHENAQVQRKGNR